MRDWLLLRQYVEEGSNRAFDEIVARYGKLVYSASLREAGDPELAQDVFQTVFIILARKAPRLKRGVVLSGWLYRTARLASREVIREEMRRTAREEKAAAMNEAQRLEADAAWQKVDPILPDALDTLSERDRNLILLRFFQEMSLREAGEELGLSENAARMRVSRSLAKMRKFLERRGAALSVTALAALLAERAARTEPPQEVLQFLAQAVGSDAFPSSSAIPLTPIAKGVLQQMLHFQIKRLSLAAGAVTVVLGAAVFAAHIVVAQQSRVVHKGDIGPVALVRQYLTARAAANAGASYSLLSSASRKQMPASTYDHWQEISRSAPGDMPLALMAFLADGKNASKANYQITGPERANPEIVDVAGSLPNAKPILIKVVTAWDDTDHARRIDLMQTFVTTDPALAEAAKTTASATASMSNLRQLDLAIIQYAAQTGRFPDAGRWMDEILPFVTGPVLFRDPADPNQRPYGYAYNRALSGVTSSQVHSPSGTVLLFESTLGTKNGASLDATLPDPGPVDGRTGIAFVDGHVEMIADSDRQKLLWQP
ncbi:MAG TPA: sigma-70 family RNA polymerase sigma factor [Capsulimonadaceae bacterium]|nr:sigma-70 family RNA polymerase sigma factor [Capsulimonadaceae bacterium]